MPKRQTPNSMNFQRDTQSVASRVETVEVRFDGLVTVRYFAHQSFSVVPSLKSFESSKVFRISDNHVSSVLLTLSFAKNSLLLAGIISASHLDQLLTAAMKRLTK
jgi:hypothetical protein